MKKKYIVLLFVITAFASSFITYSLLKDNKSKDTNSITTKKKSFTNSLSMMLETDSDTGIYELTTSSEWPSEGYKFNSELSKCENGGKLSWDDENNQVIFKGNTTDKCYVYFDVIALSELCNDKTLSECIKAQYTSQGVKNLYLHDSTLENGANDGSYRYAGANPNNYVCFGSDEETCPSDNLYRIIGIFGNQVKLIKSTEATSDMLGTDGAYNTYSSGNDYYWDRRSDYNNTWSHSLLNTTNLNTNYINYLDTQNTKWAQMIASTTWKVGGNTGVNITGNSIPKVYQNEIVNPVIGEYSTDGKTEYEAQIGLMYASDFGYAASPSAWTTVLYNYDSSSVKRVNWMSSDSFVYEWTITRASDTSVIALIVEGDGGMSGMDVSIDFQVRPCFYLSSSVKYDRGDGDSLSPYRVSNLGFTSTSN